MKYIILLLFTITANAQLPPPAQPGTYGSKLIWDHQPGTTTIADGFKVYYGPDLANMTSSLDAGKLAESTGLSDTYEYDLASGSFVLGKSYCWAIAAYTVANSELFESAKSVENCGVYMSVPKIPVNLRLNGGGG